jgi:hypothetical protein
MTTTPDRDHASDHQARYMAMNMSAALRMVARLAATSVVCLAAALGAGAAVANAEVCPSGSAYADCGAGWMLVANTYPTTIEPGTKAGIQIELFNIGANASNGPVTVTDTLPPGITATSAGFDVGPGEAATGEIFYEEALWDCTIAPGTAANSVVTCQNNQFEMPHIAGGGGLPSIYYEGRNKDQLLGIAIKAPATSSAGTNRVTVGGGSAPVLASTEDPIVVGTDLGAPRVSNLDTWFSNANGTVDTQAGSHPYTETFSFNFADERGGFLHSSKPVDGAQVRELEFNFPPGFVGDPTAVAQCTRQRLDEKRCPQNSQVGVIAVIVVGGQTYYTGVYNVVPPADSPAELGFEIEGNVTVINTSVRSGGDYGLTTRTPGITERDLTQVVLTLWGEPGDPSHDIWRNAFSESGCSQEELAQGKCNSPGVGKPFLTLPTACAGPQTFSVRVNTWEHQTTWTPFATRVTHDSQDRPVGFTGCEHLRFVPSVTAEPDTARSDSPTGLTVEVKPEVGGLTQPEGLSTADVQNTTVTLPRGVVINPGQAAGLQACQPGQDGLTTEVEKAEGKEDDGPPACPNASKVGTDEIETPLLPHTLQGSVYVLQSNPPELKLLVAASGEGVNLKLVGVVHLNEQTGQLTTTFAGTPELPFTDFKLAFSGGAQAALDTPAECGAYGTAQGFAADFTPWSSPLVSDAFGAAEFALTEGSGGGACPASPLPFSPTMVAGATTDHAGGFTDFSLLLERGDGQQRIERLQFTAPEGLAGMISAVPQCGEPQAAEGTCPSSSQVGHAVVASGPGPYPLVIPQPGEPESPIYLTGPYKGAPFGLSIVTHVLAGPFNLGTIITRATIAIDPRTAQITVTTDPLPQIVDGVPTDLRLVDSVIDRPGFMFNPTNCEPSSFTGTAWGAAAPGMSEASESAAISSHFGVGSCKELEFKPTLLATTKGQSSKADGSAVAFKIAYPKGAQGNESWFDEAKFDLPRQLPARLTTLQQACLSATFEANRGGCPKASIIGHAIVHTPVLPVPLEGPVYFVSYGGAKFPDAVLVLEGDNVHIELHGETFIDSKTGVTSATFRNTPDVPFESIEVTLPAGQYSEFGSDLPAKAQYSFCGQKLTMPTFFKAQNGLEIHQETPVAVTGCAPAIRVLSDKVKGATATIVVSVPSAGKLTATGKGVSKGTSKAAKAGSLTVKVALTAREAAVLGKHKGRKLKATVRLQFAPKAGSRLSTTTTVVLG